MSLGTIYLIAWIGAAFFVTYMTRGRRNASIFLGTFAMWPLGSLLAASYYGQSSPISVSEAPTAVIFISAITGGVIAFFAGLGLTFLWELDRRAWIASGLLGLTGGLLCFPAFAFFRAPHGWQNNYSGFPYTVVIQISVCTALSGLGLKGQSTSRIVPAAVTTGIAFLIALYYLPDIAFRLHSLNTPLSPLEEMGARRALRRSDSAVEGQRALAQGGDPKEIANFTEKIRRADITGLENDMVVLAARSAGDAGFRQALLEGLRAAIARYRDDNTFDETDRAIEAYCQAFSRAPDSRAVPDLIRAYRLTDTNINIRGSSAEALGKAKFPAADEFVLEELGRLHPVRDREIALKLVGGHDGAVVDAYKKFTEAGVAQRSRMKERDEPVRALVARGDIDAIVRRALSDDSGADQATIELIKRKHPKRFEAVAKHAGLRIRGADFTTFRDPELYRYLANRDLMAMENGHITRFICDWAPMESCALLGRLLKTDFASSAVVGLSHCPNSEAPKLLLGRLRVAKSGETLPYSLIRALGMKGYDPAATEIAGWADGKKTAGTFVADGTMIEIGEVARWALSRMNSPKARALSARFPVRDASWSNKWKWS